MTMLPEQVSQIRLEKTVENLCTIIDRKLSDEKENLPLTFTFLPQTSQEAIDKVKELYSAAGWNAILDYSNSNTQKTLYLSSKLVVSGDKWWELFDLPSQTRLSQLYSSWTKYIGPQIYDNFYSLFDKLFFQTDNNDFDENDYNGHHMNETITFDIYDKNLVPNIVDRFINKFVDRENKFSHNFIKENVMFDVKIPANSFNNAVHYILGEIENIDNNNSGTIIMNSRTYHKIIGATDSIREYFDETCNREFLMIGLRGNWANADVYTYNFLPDDLIYILPISGTYRWKNRLFKRKFDKSNHISLIENSTKVEVNIRYDILYDLKNNKIPIGKIILE